MQHVRCQTFFLPVDLLLLSTHLVMEVEVEEIDITTKNSLVIVNEDEKEADERNSKELANDDEEPVLISEKTRKRRKKGTTGKEPTANKKQKKMTDIEIAKSGPIFIATFSTVGTFSLPSDDLKEDIHGGIPCLIMTTSTGVGLFCVEMDCASSLFVSPLYEHQLVLTESSRELNPLARQMINTFPVPKLYEVKDWKKWTCKIEDGLTVRTLPKSILTLLQKTFFIQQYNSRQDSVIFREIFYPKFPSYSQPFSSLAPLDIAKYTKQYEEVEKKRGVPKQTVFWRGIVEQDGELMVHAVNQLFAYEKKNTTYPTITNIAVLFDKWRDYKSIVRYMTHKIIEMGHIFKIHQTLKEDDNDATNIDSGLLLLKDAAAFQILNCSIAKNTLVSDSSIFIHKLWEIMNTDDDNPTTSGLLLDNKLFQHYTILIDSLYVNNGIHAILELLFKYTRNPKERYQVIRKNVITRFILPLLLFKLEKIAIINTLNSKSTVDCVRIRVIYGMCKYLFRVPCGITSFNLAQEDTKSFGPRLFEFDTDDFNHILTVFYYGVITKSYIHWGNKYQWRHKDYKEEVELNDDSSALFYIDVHPTLIAIEKRISTLYRKFIETPCIDIQVRESHNLLENGLFNPLDQNQQIRVAIFTPIELKQQLDITTMKRFAFDAEFYNTSIIRESSTNHFFISRLANSFCDEIGDENWYHELYFETTHFQNINDRAIRKRVIIADSHLLTGEDLLNMLKWIMFHKERIKEVILVGCVAILPCIQNGQPFMDLTFKINRRQVFGIIGRKDAAADDFKRMVEHEWSQFKWTQERKEKKNYSLRERHDFLIDPSRLSKCSVLYHMESMGDLQDFFTSIYPDEGISLINLYEEKQKIVFNLGKKSLIKVTDVKLDNLLQHKKSLVDQKLEFFITSCDLVTYMSKSQLNLIFSTLDKLIILGKFDSYNEENNQSKYKKVKDIMGLVTTRFMTDNRPNMRYTYDSTTFQ